MSLSMKGYPSRSWSTGSRLFHGLQVEDKPHFPFPRVLVRERCLSPILEWILLLQAVFVLYRNQKRKKNENNKKRKLMSGRVVFLVVSAGSTFFSPRPRQDPVGSLPNSSVTLHLQAAGPGPPRRRWPRSPRRSTWGPRSAPCTARPASGAVSARPHGAQAGGAKAARGETRGDGLRIFGCIEGKDLCQFEAERA